MNYYEILGITKEATNDEIKKAYRNLGKIYHPDIQVTGDKEKFNEVAEAYNILIDPAERELYDKILSSGGFNANPQSDIYSNVFSSKDQLNKKVKGKDIKVSIKISFEHALKGFDKDIRIPRKYKCKECSGKGKFLVEQQGCERCGGTREIIESSTNMFNETVKTKFVCPACKDVEDTYEICEPCGGKGEIVEYNIVPIVVPKGVKSGTIIRVAEQGSPGINGGPNGDLEVKVEVKDDSPYRIVDNHLEYDMDVKFKQLVLGDIIEMSVLGTKVYCSIPPKSNPGDVVDVRNTGFKIGNSATDAVLKVTLRLSIPQELTDQQVSLLRELNL